MTPNACAMIRRCAGLSAARRPQVVRHQPSQMGRFETRWLTAEKNLRALANLSGQWIDRVQARRSPRSIVLDMDSSVSPTHGEQEMSVWNGHFECTCYHPLFVFNQFGDLERCANFVPATFTAPTAGGMCWSLSLSVTGNGTCAATSGAMPPSPLPTSMSSWRQRATSIRSVSRPTRSFRTASPTC